MHWTLNKDVNCLKVASIMSRNRFQDIKSLLHVCNNSKSELNDKWFKLPPLIYVVNKKLMQFCIFSHYLSIDEQMIPYFGRHSCNINTQ